MREDSIHLGLIADEYILQRQEGPSMDQVVASTLWSFWTFSFLFKWIDCFVFVRFAVASDGLISSVVVISHLALPFILLQFFACCCFFICCCFSACCWFFVCEGFARWVWWPPTVAHHGGPPPTPQ